MQRGSLRGLWVKPGLPSPSPGEVPELPGAGEHALFNSLIW